MSVVTTKALKVLPASAAATLVQAGAGTNWRPFGSWVEFISSAATDIAFAGIVVECSTSGNSVEVQIGVGAAGAEIPVISYPIYYWNTANTDQQCYYFQRAVRWAPAGSRVAIRTRAIGPQDIRISLLYYEDLPEELGTTSKLNYVPQPVTGTAQQGASLVKPATTAWTNGSWVEVTPGIAEILGVAGVVLGLASSAGNEHEVDIGIGAADAEEVIATVRVDYQNGGVECPDNPIVWLPAARPVPANTRIAMRVRGSTSDGFTAIGYLLYWGEIDANLPPTVDAGPDQTVAAPSATVQLDGSVTDINGDPVTQEWAQVSGPQTAVFSDTSIVNPTVFLPAIGTYVFSLTGDDGELTASDTVTITLQEQLDVEQCPSGHWGFTINDVDRKDRVRLGSVTIEYLLGSPGILRCDVIDTGDPATAFRPAIGEVIVVTKGVRVFTGKIVSTDEDPFEINVGTVTHISAVDYQRALAKRKFTKNYDAYAVASEPPEDGECAMVTERSVIYALVGDGINAQIGTAYPHGLTTGDRVTFNGVLDASPTINDLQFEVTVTGEDTFTIVHSLTTPGSGGKVLKLVQINEIFDDLVPYLAAYGITVNIEDDGPWVVAPDFNLETLEDVINYATQAAQWVYRMSPYKVLQAFSPGSVVAPFELNDDNANVLGGVPQRRTREDYANALYVRGGRQGAAGHSWNRRSSWLGDGVTTEFQIEDPGSWTIGANCTHPGILYVDGVPNPVTGLHPDDDGSVEWTWDVATKTLHHTIGSPPASGVFLEFVYHGPENFVIYVTDDVAIAANGGEIEEEIYDVGENATPATARGLALVELARRTATERRAPAVQTDQCLALPGTVIPVDIPGRLMSDEWMVVGVRMTDSEAIDPDGSKKAFYSYDLLEAGRATTWIDYWKSLSG